MFFLFLIASLCFCRHSNLPTKGMRYSNRIFFLLVVVVYQCNGIVKLPIASRYYLYLIQLCLLWLLLHL